MNSFVHAVLKMKRVFRFITSSLFALFLMMHEFNALRAQQQPLVSCLQVDELGNVTINWSSPSAGSTGFSHYEVLYSISPDLAFTSIGNNLGPFALNSFTHVSNLALGNSYYYFVQSWYDDGTGGLTSFSSDTLSTIHLEAQPAQFNCSNCDSAAFLVWNEPLLP